MEALKVFLSVIGIILIVFFVVGATMGIIAQIEIPASVAEFKSVKMTVDTARLRGDISDYEIAAIQQKIIESNEWLARTKYIASIPLIGWAIKRFLRDLEPIK